MEYCPPNTLVFQYLEYMIQNILLEEAYNLLGDLGLCLSNEDDINSSFERVKDYVKSLGFATGGGSWERDNGFLRGPSDAVTYRVYQILIQK